MIDQVLSFRSRAIFGTLTVALGLGIALSGCSKKSPSATDAKTLHLVSVMKLKGLDPVLADDLYSGRQVSTTYEALYTYHYLKRPLQLEPQLAEALPTQSADGKVLTIKLKQGVLFQDDPCFEASKGKGREVLASDFIYSIKRLADPKSVSPGFWVVDGKIVGLNEWRDAASKAGKADYSAEISGLKAIDNHTVQITLGQRSYQFVHNLTQPFTSIVPHEAVEFYKEEFLLHPVGTGPFRLSREESNINSRLVWVKNPTFRKQLYPSEGDADLKERGLLSDAGKTLPRVDRITVDVIVEDQPRWLNLLSGSLDAVIIPKDNYSTSLEPGKRELNSDLKQKQFHLAWAAELDVAHESFNMVDPLFSKNKLLRQAISMALDSNEYIRLFFGGYATPAQGPIPPGLDGYDPAFKNPNRVFNLEKAKELLAKAGYPGGKGLPPLERVDVSRSTNRQVAEWVEKSLGALGIKVQTNFYTWPEFQQMVKKHKGHMWGFAWRADYPDAENFLQLLYGKNVSPGPNDASYQDADYDKMYEKSLTLAPGAERTALYKAMTQKLADDIPWIPIHHREEFTVLQGRVRNYWPSPVDHDNYRYYGLQGVNP